MKTNHVKWEEMWERDFANYVGWTVNSQNSYQSSYLRTSNTSYVNSGNSNSEPNSDTGDSDTDDFRLNSYSSENTLENRAKGSQNSSAYIQHGNQYKSADNSYDKFYPVDTYIESIPEEANKIDTSDKETGTKESVNRQSIEVKSDTTKSVDAESVDDESSNNSSYNESVDNESVDNKTNTDGPISGHLKDDVKEIVEEQDEKNDSKDEEKDKENDEIRNEPKNEDINMGQTNSEAQFAKTCSQPENISEASTGQGFTFACDKEEAKQQLPCFCIPKTLAITAIDTSNLKRPKTKVTFSCNIHFAPRGITGTAHFEFLLYSSCNFGSESLVGNWSYEITDKDECLAQPFKFCFLSQYSFPGKYNYYVRVIPVCIKSCCVSITNCQLDIIAQSD